MNAQLLDFSILYMFVGVFVSKVKNFPGNEQLNKLKIFYNLICIITFIYAIKLNLTISRNFNFFFFKFVKKITTV